MQARPGAAGLTHDAARDEPGSARVAEARHRARERRDAQRQALRPLGVLFIAVVVTASAQTHPAPGLRGAWLAVLVVLLEALADIARCAPGAVTAVTVTYQADRTVVTIEDHVSAPAAATLADAGGGHGLTAMRERVARVGGTARAGPTAGGWLVELQVPA
jgi:signal transduction histidine kinase